MFKLSYKLLTSRIKWMIFLVVVFGFIISSVVSIFTASSTIKFGLFYKSFQQYGEFSGVLYNLSEKNIDIIEEENEIGRFAITGSLCIEKNKLASVGWVDQEFTKLGHIKLISGNFPQNFNEVAIESYYLQSIDSTWEVGEFRSLKIENEYKQLKLVGIVENYSAKWSDGKISFPNLFVSSNTKNSVNAYLIGFNNNNIKQSITNIENLINANNGNGFLNDMLLYNGLKDINNITIISFCIQLFILLVASLSIIIMMSYFNANQMTKFAVFKVLGCTNKMLFIISTIQTLLIYVFGLAFSSPLLFIFHYILTRNTYGYSLIENNLWKLLLYTIIWLVLLFITILWLSLMALKKQYSNCISANLRGSISGFLMTRLSKTRHYVIKQLTIQIFSNPKNAVLALLTLSISILLTLLSYTMANESAGIWDTEIDYFLTSRKTIRMESINNMTIVDENIRTFDPSEVKKIESLFGIKYIDKNPFMMDVFPIFQEKILTASLLNLINKYAQTYDIYDDYNNPTEILISNVNYVLTDDNYFSKTYSYVNKEKLKKGVIIYLPNATDDDIERLKGRKITFKRAYISNKSYLTKNWDFTILDVINLPYAVELYNGEIISKNGITIVMSEKTALNEEITTGYKDLVIYQENDISKENADNIYNKVYSLVEGIPGSLFQYVPNVIHEQTRITEYLNFTGRFAFYISIILAICCINIVVWGKYRSQKRYWGIYRALGMSSNKIFVYLLMEILLFFIFASLISSLLYSAFLFLIHSMTYSLVFYIVFAIITMMLTLFLLVISSIYIKVIVQQDSIASLLRVVE